MIADCDPGSMGDCYTGPPGTENVGACVTDCDGMIDEASDS
jgi:hypothetical protein